jgi:DNA/RNA-binding domain of Phe-tRNA-synthetase-like protein
MIIQKELLSKFPGLRVQESSFFNLIIRRQDPRLESFKKEILERVRSTVASLEEVKNQRLVRAYRDFYWKVGIDPTKTRPAGEALARRIVGGKELPLINTFVDSYNLASAESYVAIAAFDLGKINADRLLMRRGLAGEKFLGIGMDYEATLEGVEIVIEDQSANQLIAIYPYRDSELGKVTEETRHVLLMMCGVPGLEDSDLDRASSLSRSYIERFCNS